MQSEGTPISARHSQMLLSFDDYAGPARTSPLFNNLPEAAAEEVVEEAAPPATCRLVLEASYFLVHPLATVLSR